MSDEKSLEKFVHKLNTDYDSDYDSNLVLAEAKKIFETDPTTVEYSRYQPTTLTKKSPMIKKILSFYT